MPLVGQVLDGKYSIEKPLGKGGMGTVYLATHIGTGRPVAVKVIAPDFMDRAEFVERFKREAQAAGRLRHPNVVDVTDFGFSPIKDGSEVAYLVMEYLDGCTLGEILDEEGKLPVGWSIDIIEQVCSAVGEAHRQGIIHRDLKPDNIWLEPNQRGGYTVKVLDFGIAKLEETQFAAAIGTEISIAPDGHGTVAGESQDTIAESVESETLVERGAGTIVSESETLAISGGAERAVSGQEPFAEDSPSGRVRDLDPEDRTAILPPPTNVQGSDDSDKSTVAIGDEPSTNKSLGGPPSTAALTRMGAVLGTPLYMSPEQCRGEKLTPRSDIYSLAVIAYQMFSGRMPFSGDYVEVMEGHKNEIPPPLNTKKVKKRLRGTVMNALAKEPDDRPESAEAFANKLRANSEGLGSLLTRAFVIYAERLPKFLLLAIITFLPLIILTFSRVGVNFLISAEYLPDTIAYQALSGGLSLLSFFLQIISAAILVGMTTWVVGQILAYPLRPLNVWGAFSEARTKVKSLSGTVTLSTLIATLGLVLFFIPGVWLTARFALIAPAIMMEGVKGRSAFRRSIELSKRSFRTILGVVLLSFLFPAIIAVIMGLSINSIVGNIEKSVELEKARAEIAKMKREGVEPELEPEPQKETKPAKEDDLNFRIGTKGMTIDNDEEGMAKGFRASILEGLFELLWTPLAILITSFTSVISALIYFKTRQAGGESMQGLLSKLNSANCPQSKWQERVNRRLIQSGKLTSGPGTT